MTLTTLDRTAAAVLAVAILVMIAPLALPATALIVPVGLASLALFGGERR